MDFSEIAGLRITETMLGQCHVFCMSLVALQNLEVSGDHQLISSENLSLDYFPLDEPGGCFKWLSSIESSGSPEPGLVTGVAEVAKWRNVDVSVSLGLVILNSGCQNLTRARNSASVCQSSSSYSLHKIWSLPHLGLHHFTMRRFHRPRRSPNSSVDCSDRHS